MSDEGLLGEVNRRLAELEKRATALEEPIHVKLPPELEQRICQLEGVTDEKLWHRIHVLEDAKAPADVVKRLVLLQETVKAISKKVGCKHEMLRLDPRIPMYLMAIVDESKMRVMTPGKSPQPDFAVAMCRKCGMAYVAIDKASEREMPPPAPIKLVKPGEEVPT